MINNPLDIPDLQRWTYAGAESYSNGDLVSEIHDQSPNNYNWLPNGTPATAYEPTFVTNGLNNLPEFNFSSQGEMYSISVTDHTDATLTYVMSLHQDITGSMSSPIYCNGAPDILYSPDGPSWGVFRQNKISSPVPYPEGAPHLIGSYIVTIRCSSKGYDTWINGIRQGTYQLDAGYLGFEILGPGNFSLSEEIQFVRGIIDTEIDDIHNYLSNKYNITLHPELSNTEAGNWVFNNANPILVPTLAWEDDSVYEPRPIKISDNFWVMTYTGGWNVSAIGFATGNDGINWTKKGDPIVGAGFNIDTGAVARSNSIYLNGIIYTYYADNNFVGNIRRIQSSNLGETWSEPITILNKDDAPEGIEGWANSAIEIVNGIWYIFIEGTYATVSWNLWYATSTDGVNFSNYVSLSALQRGTGGYSCASPHYFNNLWHVWYHASWVGLLQSQIWHSTSPDLITWYNIPNPVITIADCPDYGQIGEIDQIADIKIIDFGDGKTIGYVDQDNNAVVPGKARILRVDLPFSFNLKNLFSNRVKINKITNIKSIKFLN